MTRRASNPCFLRILFPMRQVIKNFCKCGVTGWCLEVMFTSLESVRSRDWRFMGRTSILMFPIYGMGALLEPIGCLCDRISGKRKAGSPAVRAIRHGALYMCLIFAAEYLSGAWLREKNMCPWDYSQCRANIHGLIRLDFAPLWFATGLLFEQLTKKRTGNGF